MPDVAITVSGVAKQLSMLNPEKAAGPDNLTSGILIELHNEIVPILTDIFDTSLSERYRSQRLEKRICNTCL